MTPSRRYLCKAIISGLFGVAYVSPIIVMVPEAARAVGVAGFSPFLVYIPFTLMPLTGAILLSHVFGDRSQRTCVAAGFGCLTAREVMGRRAIENYKITTLSMDRPRRGKQEAKLSCPFCGSSIPVKVRSVKRTLRNRLAVLFVPLPIFFTQTFKGAGGSIEPILILAALAVWLGGGALGLQELLLAGDVKSALELNHDNHRFFEVYELTDRNWKVEESLRKELNQIRRVRDERKLREQQAVRPQRVKTSDPEYVSCSECGFEQWRGYLSCQKCGISFDRLTDSES